MFIREKNKPRLQPKKKKKNNIPKECRRNKIIITESNERETIEINKIKYNFKGEHYVHNHKLDS